MNKLQDFWNFLDGKKTIIGAAIDFAVGVISLAQTSFGFQVITPDQLMKVHDFALMVITVGLGHRVVKQIQ